MEGPRLPLLSRDFLGNDLGFPVLLGHVEDLRAAGAECLAAALSRGTVILRERDHGVLGMAVETGVFRAHPDRVITPVEPFLIGLPGGAIHPARSEPGVVGAD